MYPTIRILSTFALILGTLPASRSAEPSSAPATVVPIDTLIGQLGNKQFRVRQAAGKSLEDRGEEALPILRKSIVHPDPEIRRRAEVLTEKIERNVLLSPKRVTVQAIDQPIEHVLAEIARQTGYHLHDNTAGTPSAQKITLDLKNVTYWEAMQRICSISGLAYNVDEQQGQVFLYAQNTVSPYICTSGPFRFVASNFNYNRYVNLANLPRIGPDPNQQQDNLGFGFFIQSEPKSPLLQVGMPRLLKAEDDRGGSLMPTNVNDETYSVRYEEFNQFRSFQHQANVAMHKPNKDAQKAKIIQGKVMLTLLSSIRPDVTVDKLAVGMKKKVSGLGTTAEVVVEELIEQNKNYGVTLIIRRKGAVSENDYNWINTIQQKLELLDENGQRFTCQGPSNFIENSPMSVHGTYTFVPPQNGAIGKPAKLILNQWLSIAHEVDFEFRDIPLP